MEVIVGKLAGFCNGVANAVKVAKEVSNGKKTYCFGELVHNKQVIEELEKNGIETVEDLNIIPNNSTVIFRAHGVRKQDYEQAKNKNLNIVDLTCGNVKLIHKKIEDRKNDFIILIGEKNHPEVIGSKSFSNNCFIIENESDILDAYMEYEKLGCTKVFVVAQTTFSSKKFDELLEEINNNFAETIVEFDKTICLATENRQAEMINMSKEIDNMVIIGGKNSANTRKLVEIAKTNCQNVYHIQTVDDLKNVDLSNVEKIGIAAGASTPKEIIEKVRMYLESK